MTSFIKIWWAVPTLPDCAHPTRLAGSSLQLEPKPYGSGCKPEPAEEPNNFTYDSTFLKFTPQSITVIPEINKRGLLSIVISVIPFCSTKLNSNFSPTDHHDIFVSAKIDLLSWEASTHRTFLFSCNIFSHFAKTISQGTSKDILRT